MPGIVGLISNMPRERAEEEVRRMVEAIRHEAFYETGTWSDPSEGVYAGWTALENSFSSGMPFHNKTGSISLLFSGEEYSEPARPKARSGPGLAPAGEGPAYLAELAEEDPSFPGNLNGLFHGLLFNRGSKTTTLFNDRYGMHRLYYHEAKDGFYFASEAKAILAVRPELRKVDPRSLGEFVACSCVLEDRTLFKGINALPAGSAWVFRSAALERKHTYFCPQAWEDQVRLDPEPFYENVRDIFSRNLQRYFAGGQRVGMTLTGGLDTRMITAWREFPPGSLPCYTFGGMFRDSQDVRIGRQVASFLQQPHQVIEVGDEFLKRFPHYAERSVYLTEGGVDVYRASDLYVSERARTIAPVKVVGTYGSEILRHAVMFKPMTLPAGLFQGDFLTQVDQARNTYLDIRRAHPVTFAAFRQSPWYHHGILSLEQTQLTVRSPYLDNDFVRTVYRGPASASQNDDLRLRLIREGNPTLGKIRTDRGVGGGSGPLVSNAARIFHEFTFKSEYAYDYGMPQWVNRVDHAFSALHLERLFLGRHKLLHFRVWYRDTLSEYVKQILLDPRTLSRPYLERKTVEEMVRTHTKGVRNNTTAIHKLLTFELLHRLFLDPQ